MGGSDREPRFCECLCASLAKKNKAGEMLGSDFSMEAWQETGSSGGDGEGVWVCVGGWGVDCMSWQRNGDRTSSSPAARPARQCNTVGCFA